MATGGEAIKTPGDVVLDASGNRIICDDGVACCPNPCSRCSTTTPSTILLRCAGWSVGTTCQGNPDRLIYKFNSLSINTDFCLPICTGTSFEGGDTCTWGDVFSGVVDFDSYCAPQVIANCGDTTDSVGNAVTHIHKVYLQIHVWRDTFFANTWHVQFAISESFSGCLVTGVACSNLGGFQINPIITASDSSSADCTTTISCTVGTPLAPITAGTIQIIPNGC